MQQSISFYKRTLPEDLIAFSSVQGRTVFQEALLDETMYGFFPLIEQFSTQQEPAYCGLSTLAQVLNAMGLDPQRRWKGPWRWYSEELLDCCVPLETVKQQGISLEEFQCLSRCNGVKCDLIRPGKKSREEEINDFRKAILQCMSEQESSDMKHMVISFSRTALKQTGSGHFSPVGGYNRRRDLVLVLDSARFKYPPFWVDLTLLYDSMIPKDEETGLSRGYLVLTKKNTSDIGPLFCRIQPAYSWSSLVNELRKVVSVLLSSELSDLESIVKLFAQLLESEVGNIIQPFTMFFGSGTSDATTSSLPDQIRLDSLSDEYKQPMKKLFAEAKDTKIYSILSGEVYNNQENTETSCKSCSCSHKKHDLSQYSMSQEEIKSVLLTILFLGIPSEYFREAQCIGENATRVKQLIFSAREKVSCKSGCSSCFEEVNRIQLQIEAVTKCVDRSCSIEE
jgi:hypothetical protein